MRLTIRIYNDVQGRLTLVSKGLTTSKPIGYLIHEECVGVLGFYAFLSVVAEWYYSLDTMPIDVYGSVHGLRPYKFLNATA